MYTAYECPLEGIPRYGVRGNLSELILATVSLIFLLLKEHYNGSMEKCKFISELVKF
jgi:hypothetical protein